MIDSADDRHAAVDALRAMVLAGESHRQAVSSRGRLGYTDTQAISHLVVTGPMGQTQLAEALGITTSSVTSLIDRMERDGLVSRAPHPTDRRRQLVALTPKGETLVQRVDRSLTRVFDGVADERLGDVTETLRSVTTALRAEVERLHRG